MSIPATEFALSKDEFENVLTDPLFIKRVRKIANFTLKEEREGGMAIYKSKDGKVKYSPAVTPEIDEVKNSLANMDELGLPSWGHEYITFNPVSLIAEYVPALGTHDGESMRPDVAMLMHSHPSFSSVRDPKGFDFLTPSDSDLSAYAEFQRTHNQVIEAILGANKNLGKMAILFWRLSENKEFQPNYLHALAEESRVSAGSVRHYMQNSGLNIATASYSLRQSELLDSPSSVSSALFA